MQFRVLGALEAGAGAMVADLGPPKQRALLAILILHIGEIVSIDRLIDLLWGDDPPRTASHSIQIYVSDLRKAMEPMAGRRLIHTRPPGYQLDAPPESVDARRFEALIAEGSSHLHAGERDAAIAALRSALGLWRGPALSDFAYEEFAQPYVRRFHDLHLDAVEALASAELEAAQASRVVPLLEAAIREDPLRERSRELLMIALYRTGRHAEALRTFDRLRELLVEELGLEPSPALQRLRDRVLLHDPELLADVRREPPRTAPRNPYKGLEAFGEDDADDFFGREALVGSLLDAIAGGRRLIALVGPSGSGKSSVVAAGLIPRLRKGALPGSDRWAIAPVELGPDPFGAVRSVTARLPRRAAPIARVLLEPDGPSPPAAGSDGGDRLVLVLDQFEQVFTGAEESRRNEFLRALSSALSVADGRLLVVISLRADFYDRPLQHPEFSAVFVPGVVHVLPMTARELEGAIVDPAEQVGASVEPALLAELIGETVARPGGLPLLQYALTELFERRRGPMLTLADYAALGGLRGVLSRRAEEAFLGLSADEQRVAMQVFMRLVRLGRGTADSRRRLTVSDLTDLGSDSVALSSVLAAFGRHRLLTFDRDPVSGEATVELAHEALLTEWERLAAWIDRHRTALRRRDALLAAVEEWELSDRNPDYLLSGSRLAEFETLSREGTVQLTTREREFVEAGVERQRVAAAADAAQVEVHRRLARSARVRLMAFGVAILALGGAGIVWGLAALNPPPRPVALMWTDEGLLSGQIIAGFDRAVTEFGLPSRKFTWDGVFAAVEEEHGRNFWEERSPEEAFRLLELEQQRQLRQRAAEGVGLIVLLGVFVDHVEPTAREHPETIFAIDQPSEVPNILTLSFLDAEPSYLAGAAAALKSETGVIGYVGGVDWQGIWAFQAGYEAGARAIDPDVRVVVDYLSVGDFSGFNDEVAARVSAMEMYRQGADVVFHAAGTSGLGVFEAALEYSRDEGRHVWAIGVDTDQYETVMRLPGAANAGLWRAHILTSVLKGIDQMVYEVLAQHARGRVTGGSWNWGLASGALGISYSGGYIDEFRPRLEELQARIIGGDIEVPCIPPTKRDQAAAIGIGPDECYY